jgi:hypothetical protein
MIASNTCIPNAVFPARPLGTKALVEFPFHKTRLPLRAGLAYAEIK